MKQELSCITNLPVVTLNTLQEEHFVTATHCTFPEGTVLGDKADEESLQGLHVSPGEDVVHD